jgi:hypothetical protein
MMPPYHHSTDLLEAKVAAPPPDAATAWRHARITRLAK